MSDLPAAFIPHCIATLMPRPAGTGSGAMASPCPSIGYGPRSTKGMATSTPITPWPTITVDVAGRPAITKAAAPGGACSSFILKAALPGVGAPDARSKETTSLSRSEPGVGLPLPPVVSWPKVPSMKKPCFAVAPEPTVPSGLLPGGTKALNCGATTSTSLSVATAMGWLMVSEPAKPPTIALKGTCVMPARPEPSRMTTSPGAKASGTMRSTTTCATAGTDRSRAASVLRAMVRAIMGSSPTPAPLRAGAAACLIRRQPGSGEVAAGGSDVGVQHHVRDDAQRVPVAPEVDRRADVLNAAARLVRQGRAQRLQLEEARLAAVVVAGGDVAL